jgi:putative ABC transport system permease protein
VLGTGFAFVGLRIALALTPVHVIRMAGVELDWGVLGFTAWLALVTTVLAGLAPALQVSHVQPTLAIGSVRGDVVPMRRRVRRALVAFETALSLVLVIGAALLVKSFVGLRSIELGFDPANVLTAQVALPRADYPAAEQVDVFFHRLIERIDALPGAESAAAARILPFSSSIGNWSIVIEAQPQQPGANPNGDWQIVTPGYFHTMRIQLVAGRFMTPADRTGAPLVALVSEAMAETYWPGTNAVGKRFHLGTRDQPWITIVGVVRNVRHNAVTETPRREMYLPHSQWPIMRGDGSPQRSMTLVVRTARDPLALATAVRDQVRALDPSLPVAEITTMDDITATALAEPRFTTLLLGSFAALALLLAAIGNYGVISFTAARRTHELGIRIALGASRISVAGSLLGEGLLTAGCGVAVGLLASFWLTRLIAGQLYGVTPLDPAVFVAVPVALIGVAALASYLPARRAARISPLIVLKTE